MSNLLEEYKLCVQRVQALDKNIWQSATIFGIGSLAGIITVFRYWEQLNKFPPSAIIISFLGITINLVWWRLAKRWWSIQQAIIKRIEHIESKLNFGANLYVAYLDQINCCAKKRPLCDMVITAEVKNELSQLLNYECRGIQPVLWFLTFANTISWLLVTIAFNYHLIIKLEHNVILTIVLFIGIFLWFFFEIWNRP